MPHRPPIAPYLAVQGVLVVLWWLGLALSPPFRAFFLAPGARDTELLAFWLPDLVLVAAGSFVAAAAVHRARPWAGPALWLLSGALAYATLYCLALSLLTGGAWLGTAAMLPALLLTLLCTVHHTRQRTDHAQGRSAA